MLYVLSELIGAFLAGYFTHFVMWRQRIMARGTRHALAPACLSVHISHDGFAAHPRCRPAISQKAMDDEPSVRASKSKGIVDQGAHLEAAA